jgi:hypothetical protein
VYDSQTAHPQAALFLKECFSTHHKGHKEHKGLVDKGLNSWQKFVKRDYQQSQK